MIPVLVDSNVLLDVLTGDPQWAGWSEKNLSRVADSSSLVINPLIYAEVSIRFSRIEDLEAALPTFLLKRESIPYEAAFLAGKVYLTYLERGGTRIRPLPDFFIGAHAAVAGYRLLTRDLGRYTTYFPNLELISP
ncbi:MAG: type II toxin-antitoxin system VapC family toxin [Magnetococcales bacterium]|nr:type II toxin-antitoxin system VapC family toxin [Magnetococcales bacterium]